MENKCVGFIRSNSWADISLGHGEYNGYVAVPPTNKYHGKSYLDIDEIISVHGGLTFSEPASYEKIVFSPNHEVLFKCTGKRNPVLTDAEIFTENKEIGDDWWIFGFDTFHSGDTPEEWDRAAVIAETERLLEQLEN